MRGHWEPVSILVVILGLAASIVAGIAIANSDRSTAVWASGALLAAAVWLAAPWRSQPRKGLTAKASSNIILAIVHSMF